MKFINNKGKLILIDDDYHGDDIIEVEDEQLPQAFFPFYKLDDNGNIVPDDERILEKAKKIVISNVKVDFKEAIKNGYYSETFNITMDCDFFDAMKLKSGIELMQQLGQTQMIVRDHFNKDHLMSIENANKLVVEVGLYYLSQWKKKGKLIEKIEQAQTLEEVLNITWEEDTNDGSNN